MQVLLSPSALRAGLWMRESAIWCVRAIARRFVPLRWILLGLFLAMIWVTVFACWHILRIEKVFDTGRGFGLNLTAGRAQVHLWWGSSTPGQSTYSYSRYVLLVPPDTGWLWNTWRGSFSGTGCTVQFSLGPTTLVLGALSGVGFVTRPKQRRGSCQRCGYQLRGSTTCPECGTDTK